MKIIALVCDRCQSLNVSSGSESLNRRTVSVAYEQRQAWRPIGSNMLHILDQLFDLDEIDTTLVFVC